MDFLKVLARLADFFQSAETPWAVVGGLALQAYGLHRATQDVDLVTLARVQPRVVEELERLGYETFHRSTAYSNHLHSDPLMGRIDLVYVRGETQRKLFADCRDLKLLGRSVPVPRPEHLAAMKVLAMKNDPQRRFQEMADIQFLLRLPEVDAEEVEGYFVRHGFRELFHEIQQAT
jgi:hypothetical protein